MALRAANVEAVHEKKDGGSILRVVSGQEYEVTEYIDDVQDAVDGSNIVSLTASPYGADWSPTVRLAVRSAVSVSVVLAGRQGEAA